MLRKRVITALCGIPIIVAAIWFEQPLPWFTIVVAMCGVLAAFEFYRMVAAAKVPPLTYFGLLWVLLFILSPHFDYAGITPVLLTSAVILPLIYLLGRSREEAFTTWAWTLAGILYLGWLASHFVALRGLDEGRNWVFLALFVTFASDTSAFFIGRYLGRHHFAPRISPGKTWEGVAGGVFGAIIISLCFTLPTTLGLPLSYGQAVVLGLLVSISGQLGDLIESLLKRNMGVKDSSQWLPGHGGFLDRMDSAVFTAVVVYYYATWVM